MQKLPPYGKTLETRLKISQVNQSIYLFIGMNAWKKARNFQISRPTTMCLPPFEDPSVYKWPVSRCDIFIFDTGNCDENYVIDLATCLFNDGADAVRYLSPDNGLTIFNKEV